MSETVKVYSIREANTKGRITEHLGTISRGWFRPRLSGWQSWKVGGDVFYTLAEAEFVARANAVKRIASLERSLKAMRNNPFVAGDMLTPADPA